MDNCHWRCVQRKRAFARNNVKNDIIGTTTYIFVLNCSKLVIAVLEAN